MDNKFWKLTNAVDSSESTLILEGPIASETWWGDEVTPQAFRDELKQITSKNLTVVINSGGGDVFAGLSIYNTLRELDAEVTIRVDGLAASIASVIAMAGDKVIMSPGSMMMIHKPSLLAAGTADDLEKAIEMLNTVEASIAPIYAAKSGLSLDKISEMLEAETWMTAEQTVELGFADSLAVKEDKDSLADSLSTMFSGNKFAMSMSATKASLDSFMTKLAADTEETPAQEPTVEPDETEVPDETQPHYVATPEEETPETEPVETEEVQTAEVITTDPDKTPTTNQEVKDSTNMEPKDIAQTQVVATADVDATPKADATNYLKTRASIEDFATVLQNHAGESAQEVKAAWGEHLATMGITNPEILLPTALISEIEDAFKQGGEIWNLVRKTGLSVFRSAIDTVTGENSRAKGHTRGNTKAEELITLADRVVRAQFIYKYITLNKEDIRENRDTGALVSYVLSELPRRIVREVERAIVIGDGRAANDTNKISSFVSLKADAAANNAYASTYTPVSGESKYKTLLSALDKVEADGARYLVAKKGFVTGVLLEQGVNGGYIFAPGTNVGNALGFAGVIEPDWMTEDTTNDAYVFVPSAYTTVGDNSIESFTNFVLKENKQEYLQEIYAGGALSARKAAVAIAAVATS